MLLKFLQNSEKNERGIKIFLGIPFSSLNLGAEAQKHIIVISEELFKL